MEGVAFRLKKNFVLKKLILKDFKEFDNEFLGCVGAVKKVYFFYSWGFGAIHWVKG